MIGDNVLERIAIHIPIHGDALAGENLVILRTRKRCEDEELKGVDRQLVLDDV
jgi:hypothetical protein